MKKRFWEKVWEHRAGAAVALMLAWVAAALLITGSAVETATGMTMGQQIHQALFCPW